MVQPYERATYSRLAQLDVEDRQGSVRYCEELDCLHEDIDFISFELHGAVTLFYRNNFELKRLALVYHEDNFYFRVHAYREKLFKLVNHMFGFKVVARSEAITMGPRRGFNDEVRARLKREGLAKLVKLVDGLSSQEMLQEVLRRRNRLAHSLAERHPLEEGRPTWPTTTTQQRAIDWTVGRSDVDEFDRATDLDRLHEKKQEELQAIKRRLEQFRQEFVTILQGLGF
jgi:hypothetical protein